MTDTEYHFLVIENALKEMKFNYLVLPGRLEKNLKLIRDELGWIERHHLPGEMPKQLLSKVKEKTIYLSSEKGKNAVAFQIHTVIVRPFYELVGIKITFGTSENGNPGLYFEGTRKDPVRVKVIDLPWSTEYSRKTPKRLVKWIEDHVISSKDLSEKVEQFAVVDLGLVEMNELGLGELEHQAMENEKVIELKEKKKPISISTSSLPPPPPASQTVEVPKKKHETPPIYRQQAFGFMNEFGLGGYNSEWGPMD
jgi:hypothetical protein